MQRDERASVFREVGRCCVPEGRVLHKDELLATILTEPDIFRNLRSLRPVFCNE
jgi:hypothetical protein